MRNALTGDEPSTSRLAGDDGLDWFLGGHEWNRALNPVGRETDGQRFYRLALASRLWLMRVMYMYQASFELHVDSIDEMIVVGDMLQYLCFHAVLHVTYSFTYITKWNPYALKSIVEDIRTGPRHVFGIGLLASAQGWERLHAFLKHMFPVLTSGRKGCEIKYLQCRNMLHVTSEHKDYRPPGEFSYKPHSSRHRFDCVCCEGYRPCLQCQFAEKNKKSPTLSDGSGAVDGAALVAAALGGDGSGAVDCAARVAAALGGGGGGSDPRAGNTNTNSNANTTAPAKKRGRKAAQPQGPRCNCGACTMEFVRVNVPASFKPTLAMLRIDADRCCSSCAEIGVFISEICVENPTGFVAKVLREVELKRQRALRSARFELAEEQRRERHARAQREQRDRERQEEERRATATPRDLAMADDVSENDGSSARANSDSEPDEPDDDAAARAPTPAPTPAPAPSVRLGFRRAR